MMPAAPEIRADLLGAFRMVSAEPDRILVDGVPIEGRLPELAEALYSRWFARWWPPAFSEQRSAEEPGIIGLVRAAHAATERFIPEWMAQSVLPGGVVIAGRNGEEFHFQSGDYVNLTRLGAPVQPGDLLAVTARRDSIEPQDGWWLGWAEAGPAPPERMLRVYWNCSHEAAPMLIKSITGVLEGDGVPYTLKCPAERDLFGRCDSVVLYLSTEAWAQVRGRLRRVHETADLRDATPPLTLRLGRGAAIAEDPGNGSSFGQTISWAAAEGVLSAIAAGSVNPTEIVDAMLLRLQANGMCPDRPYLRIGSQEGGLSAW